MKTKTVGVNGSGRRQMTAMGRLTVQLPDELLKVLDAWGRTEGRSMAEQGRFLLQQLVEDRRDRLALTRR